MLLTNPQLSSMHTSDTSRLMLRHPWALFFEPQASGAVEVVDDEPTPFPMLTELNDLWGEFNMNDNNELAPRNVLEAATSEFLLDNEWGHHGICFFISNLHL